MLGALGGVSLVAMVLAYRYHRGVPVVIWAVTTALMAFYAFGGTP